MEKKPIITLNSEEKDFLFRIDSEIKSILFELPVQYHEILQVVNGSRFRPLLTYYGYKLFSENLNEKVYKSAIAIELIHKSSIIIDDIIDQDDKRHSIYTVHKQYSIDEALVITVFLLGKCIELLAEIDDSTIRVFSHMIIRMCQGTIQELNIDMNVSIDKIKEILDNQTSQVIQNCLVIGMKSYDPELDNQHLAIIGYKLGYLFQLLNDCEAYFNPEFTIKYKGNHNFDINRSRKNLCYVYLEQFLSNKEKLGLQNKDKVTNIEILLNKYSVLKHIKNEVSLIEFDIKKQCEVLEKNHSMERLNYFIDYSIKLAKVRAGIY